MQKKKTIVITIIALLLIVAIITGINAYFTSTKTVTNVFTIGNIKINLTEGNTWDAAVASGEAPENAQNIVPDQHIEKAPNVENIGANPAYIYLKVYVPVLGEEDLFTYTINATDGQTCGWTKRANEEFHTTIDGQIYNIYTYDYDEVLNPGTTTERALFDEVVFAEGMSFTPEQVESLGNVKNIIIKAYAIQTGEGIAQATNEITEIMTGDNSEETGKYREPLDVHVGEIVRYVPTGTYTWNETYSTANSVKTTALDATGNCAITNWKVLSVEGDTVNLVPANGTTNATVTFHGAQGYNNAVQLLNIACSELYKNTALGITARSINIEDFEKSQAVVNIRNQETGATYDFSDKWCPTLYADEISGNKTLSQPISKSNSDLIERNGATYIGAEQTSYTATQTYYYIGNRPLNESLSDLASKLLPNGSSTNYWLASRCVGAYSGGSGFSMYCVDDGNLSSSSVFYSDGNEYETDAFGLFPVVSINSRHLNEVTGQTYQYEVQ